ncbi:MAG TPA: enterotoxin [Steroidobacteraceae bacterium]
MNRPAAVLCALLAVAPVSRAAEPWLPNPPGTAHCVVMSEGATLANAALRFALALSGQGLRPRSLHNAYDGIDTPLSGELFEIQLRDGKRLHASDFRLENPLTCSKLAGLPAAARAADRRDGVELRARLKQPDGDLVVDLAVQLRDDTNFVRELVHLFTPHELDIAGVTLISLDLPGATVAGMVDGSPLVAGDLFLGFEHPMAQASAVASRATALVKRVLPLRAGVAVNYSAVLGVAPPGQLRRGFIAYLEAERAHPFRTFLHYNSWYDIGYFSRYSQADALSVINAFGEELVRKRHVPMDSFLFDDGWDDTSRLWQFHSGFPSGFTPLRDAATRFGAGPGIWMSPWGGYGPPRKERLATAAALGYEIDTQGLALSGPRYYALVHDVAIDLLRSYGINQFKLDGVGSPDKVTQGSAFDSDFAAAISLIDDLRAEKPDLFINLTTGTWPSPFWLRTADSIWRGGEDHLFLGEGSDRARWITYRDADTYGGIVRQGPLYPLNSVMLHGIIYARHAHGLESDPHGDFASEVWSYFGSGTGLQELYVSHDLLTSADWDVLAAAALWARARADVLRDSHWIGGDPARGEVYGWASWAPGRAVLVLRNPSGASRSFNIDLGQLLELPPHQAPRFTAHSAFGRTPPQELVAGRPLRVQLAPFEVLVWDFAAK